MRAFICFILIALASITEGALSPYGIKGGRNAPIDKFPYQVSLRLNNTYLCSGSILDNFNVLTTANCIVGRGMQCNKELKVHVGTNNLDAPGYVYDITTITVHSNYDTKLYNNDIALVHLKYSITYNKLVQPVKLPTSNEGLEGQPCTLSGWGSSVISNSRGLYNYTHSKMKHLLEKFIISL
ncbi:PREDICTED: chymotrypsin-1-like, partial [Wasmannia auropunctata]|uniref:chymotrypsin-1-like n=1 Tax=Wasmannia auropunctata TaxID=64793 RepID=UPI0005EE1709